ncbi:MAG TPA: hypothetical protein VME46_07105, partial [Acidimicrobiales bacterium]|nr:hypothetical protein [Acidimicrobiales bacterium]
MPHLRFSPKAAAQLAALDNDKGLAKRGKAVRRALAKLEVNLRHPSLNTHEFHSVPCPHGGKLFEAYAENNTPAAYRIFWCYDPDQKDTVLIVAIT